MSSLAHDFLTSKFLLQGHLTSCKSISKRQVLPLVVTRTQLNRIFIKFLVWHVKNLEKIILIYTRKEKINEVNFHNPFVQQQTEVTGQADAIKHDKTGRKIQDNNTFPQKQQIVQG